MLVKTILYGIVSAVSVLGCGQLKQDKDADNGRQLPDRVGKKRAANLSLVDEGDVDVDVDANKKFKFLVDLRVTQSKLVQEPGHAHTPFCLGPLPEDFALGEIKCAKGRSQEQLILAKHAIQQCEGAVGEFKAIKAKASLKLKNCRTAQVTFFRFSPEIAISIAL